MSVPDEIRAAAALSDALYIAQQALHVSASVRRDIVWTVTNGRERLENGQTLAEVAALTRDQGQALTVLFSRGEPQLDVIKTGMGLMGFGAQTVQDSYDFVLAACHALRDTPADGNQLETLFAVIDQTIAAPPTLY